MYLAYQRTGGWLQNIEPERLAHSKFGVIRSPSTRSIEEDRIFFF